MRQPTGQDSNQVEHQHSCNVFVTRNTQYHELTKVICSIQMSSTERERVEMAQGARVAGLNLQLDSLTQTSS